MFYKKTVLRNFTIFKGKHLCWSLFLIKLQAWRPIETFSYEYYEMFKNTVFAEYLQTAASEFIQLIVLFTIFLGAVHMEVSWPG